MKYLIIYDKPGRIRVRMGQYAFTREQGYGIENLLSREKGICSVETSSSNGGILIPQLELGLSISHNDIIGSSGELNRSLFVASVAD